MATHILCIPLSHLHQAQTCGLSWLLNDIEHVIVPQFTTLSHFYVYKPVLAVDGNILAIPSPQK